MKALDRKGAGKYGVRPRGRRRDDGVIEGRWAASWSILLLQLIAFREVDDISGVCESCSTEQFDGEAPFRYNQRFRQHSESCRPPHLRSNSLGLLSEVESGK